jgi:hypothetical protein
VRNLKQTTVVELNESDVWTISKAIVEIAKSYGIEVQSCAEKYDLENVGVKRGRCIDPVIIEDIIGYSIESRKDKNQRKECGCMESIDIGEYNTCGHNCLYCYANFNHDEVIKKKERHITTSPLLIGDITEKDIVNDRNVFSLRRKGLFD